MPFMSIRNISTMLNPITTGLTRPDPPPPTCETMDAAAYQDCSWHSSSFELARGLEVIEYRDPWTAAFADVWPALRSARA